MTAIVVLVACIVIFLVAWAGLILHGIDAPENSQRPPLGASLGTRSGAAGKHPGPVVPAGETPGQYQQGDNLTAGRTGVRLPALVARMAQPPGSDQPASVRERDKYARMAAEAAGLDTDQDTAQIVRVAS